MSNRWKAYIITVDNRLEVVEFETPGISRNAAIAQCQSMYGAKEVKSCNPISSSSSSSTTSKFYPNSSSETNMEGIGYFVVTIFLLWFIFEFWKIILFSLGVIGIVLILRWILEK